MKFGSCEILGFGIVYKSRDILYINARWDIVCGYMREGYWGGERIKSEILKLVSVFAESYAGQAG